MSSRPRPLQIVIGVLAGVALAGGGYAVAASRTTEIHACEELAAPHVLTLNARCPRGSRPVVWSVRGPAGRNGASVRLSPRVEVRTGALADARASITRGRNGVDSLHLTLPRGPAGAAGPAGPSGPAGAAGPAGPAGANTGPNAYGEVVYGSSGLPHLAYGVGVSGVSGGLGSVSVEVNNCSEPTPTKPVILVTPNNDPYAGPADATTASGQPTAYVTEFDDANSPGAHVLGFTVELTSTTDLEVNSDFAFTVSC